MRKISYALIIFSFVSFWVQPLFAISDTTPPIVSTVSPLFAFYQTPSLFFVDAQDDTSVASCTLIISSIYESPMLFNPETDRFETWYTFTTERSANSIRAVCEDTSGNSTTGKSRVISVTYAPNTTPYPTTSTQIANSEIDATDWSKEEIVATSPVLIKTACPGGEDFTHPCRTVYFLDAIGKRHAFPNEKAYFTWYTDYTDLHVITPQTMASFLLGKNVTYHPGSVPVKFPSVRKVYAVFAPNILRPLHSEDVAQAIYGSQWNKLIHDINDSFYANYTLGEPILTKDDFSIAKITQSVDSLNDIFLP